MTDAAETITEYANGAGNECSGDLAPLFLTLNREKGQIGNLLPYRRVLGLMSTSDCHL